MSLCACCQRRHPGLTEFCDVCELAWLLSAAHARAEGRYIDKDEARAQFVASGICPHPRSER